MTKHDARFDYRPCYEALGEVVVLGLHVKVLGAGDCRSGLCEKNLEGAPW